MTWLKWMWGFGPVLLAAQGVDPQELRLKSTTYFPKAAYTLRTDARQVEVGVVIRDNRGHSVGGLSKADFRISDNGRRREVTAFSVQEFVPAVKIDAAIPQSPDQAPASVPNPEAARAPRFVGLVFDDISLPPADLYHARTAAKRFLKEGLAANDRVAVLTISGGVLLPFTADVAKLNDALDHVVLRERKVPIPTCPVLTNYDAYVIANRTDPNALDVKADELMKCQPGICPTTGRRGAPSQPCPQAVAQVQGMATQLWEEIRAQSFNSLLTLKSIVDFMAQMKGTRVLLIASSGFLSGSLEAEQDQVVDHALRAGVVINGLDAKGLYVEDPPQTGSGGGVRSLIYQSMLGTRPKDSLNDAIAYFADSTGGLYFHNNNDLAMGFREIGLQPEVSYLLGFTPDAPDGKYHRLKVDLTEARHDSVQARKGYVANVIAEKPAPERKLDRELLSGSQSGEVPVQVSVQPEKPAEGKLAAHVAMRWDVTKLHFEAKAGIRSETIHMILALLDEHGSFVTGREAQMEMALTESTFSRMAAVGFTSNMSLEAPAGKYQLRAVVVEGEDGSISASTQAIELQ